MAEAPAPVVQGTVVDAGPNGGLALLDDGTRVRFPADAVRPEVRLLRRGQRVQLRRDPGGDVTSVALPGMPL